MLDLMRRAHVLDGPYHQLVFIPVMQNGLTSWHNRAAFEHFGHLCLLEQMAPPAVWYVDAACRNRIRFLSTCWRVIAAMRRPSRSRRSPPSAALNMIILSCPSLRCQPQQDYNFALLAPILPTRGALGLGPIRTRERR